MPRLILYCLSLCALLTSSLSAQQRRLAILPLSGNGIDEVTVGTVNRILYAEMYRINAYALVSLVDVELALGERSCSEKSCAVAVARQVQAERVAFGSLNQLGEKVILKYDLADVATDSLILSDDLTALRIEDLDQVVRRVAMSISLVVPAAKTVEVGLVTEQEAVEPSTRKANSSWGIAFGYLYPISDSYDNEENIFVWDFRSVYEMRNFAIDAVLGIRQGFALNVSCLYIPSRKDFSPFLGGGIGFHSVTHESYRYWDYESEDYLNPREEDGVEFVAKAGFIAFRTFDFRVIATAEYALTLNDFDDRAFLITLGVMRSGKRVFGVF